MWASQALPLASALPHTPGGVSGTLLSLDREVEAAEDLADLCDTVLSHHNQHVQNSQYIHQQHQLYAPKTLCTALLRLTDFETESLPYAGRASDEGCTPVDNNVHNQAQVLEVRHKNQYAFCTSLQTIPFPSLQLRASC